MRVIQVLRVLSIALLIIPLIAAAAVATDVEIQAPPDPGQMHILAVGTGQGTGDAGTPISGSADDGGISLISAMEPSGNTFPAAPLTCLPAQVYIPSVTIPNNPGTSTGEAVGHLEPPMIPGYWDNIDIGSLQTNMPVISISGFDNSLFA